MFKEVPLEVGKSPSNMFLSTEALPNLLGNSTLLGEQALEGESKPNSKGTGWSEMGKTSSKTLSLHRAILESGIEGAFWIVFLEEDMTKEFFSF